MLLFGCCVGPTDRFETIAGPALERVMAPQDVLVKETGADGICAAYNRILARARTLDDCEGVVLLHDDVELKGDARAVLLDALAAPGVGVVGVAGGRDLHDAQWITARHTAGYADDSWGFRRFGPPAAEVDVVDGLLLALAPAAFEEIDFDATRLPRFHGYDTDYCLRVRDAGLTVSVCHVEYQHHDKGSLGDLAAYGAAHATVRARWPQWIRPLTDFERMVMRATRVGTAQLGRLRLSARTSRRHVKARLRALAQRSGPGRSLWSVLSEVTKAKG